MNMYHYDVHDSSKPEEQFTPANYGISKEIKFYQGYFCTFPVEML